MLKTAVSKIRKHGLIDRIQLAQGLAEELNPEQMFKRRDPFDVIFYSYSLTMIPGWQKSLEIAHKHLKIGGYLYVVDFWDQAKLPGWFRKILQRWLSWFHVRHDSDMSSGWRCGWTSGASFRKDQCTATPAARYRHSPKMNICRAAFA